MLQIIYFFTLIVNIFCLQQPNIVHILVDDLGWAEVGYHNPIARAAGDVSTPNIDSLVKNGLELDRFYTEKICSPSRCALLTGRFGIHVNSQNVVPELTNPEDPIGGYQGIAVNMTGIAENLKDVGYSTHLVGKWDAGMATEYHSPQSRGFDTWLGYWHHSNDYYTQEIEQCGLGAPVKDLWRMNATTNGPEKSLANGPTCSNDNQHPDNGDKCIYEDDIFMNEIEMILTSSVVTKTPFFLFYSMHLVHMPLQVPEEEVKLFEHVDNEYRQLMHTMVHKADSYIGQVVDLLHSTGQWENTLLVVHSDNGGEIMTKFCGGNNYPLRGGKFSQFEGGIRATALVSGGRLPMHRRGQVETNLMSIADWYATYASAAGVAPENMVDKKALAADLPPIDSMDCWAMLTGVKETHPHATTLLQKYKPYSVCRNEIPIGDTSAIAFNMDGDALVGALIIGEYKLLLGPSNKHYHVGQNIMTGAFWPNNTGIIVPEAHPKVCNRQTVMTNESTDLGCLYNIYTDPSESNNLVTSETELFENMLSRLDEIQSTVYSPNRGKINENACKQAEENGNYWGPFM